mmetsp:Transcript_144408/g.255113  ORF Transcript_144408/g.255113 Transcript_144408/m.255113 type:complete len:96 (-) Transcript_144408:444-731(-)
MAGCRKASPNDIWGQRHPGIRVDDVTRATRREQDRQAVGAQIQSLVEQAASERIFTGGPGERRAQQGSARSPAGLHDARRGSLRVLYRQQLRRQL